MNTGDASKARSTHSGNTESGGPTESGSAVESGGTAETGSTVDNEGAERPSPVAAVDLDALFGAPERPRLRVSFGGTVVIALVVAAVVVLMVALQPRAAEGLPTLETTADPAPGGAQNSDFTGAKAPRLLVHVLGEVKHPGVYELAAESRVVDAVSAAGGFTERADTGSMNLARKLTDGEQVYVTALGETRPPVADAPVGGGPGAGSGAGSGSGGGLVNLNTATAAELETLPRIGPAMAQRILDYRTANGPFTSVDELTDVPGIGEATLEGLRELVTV